MQSLKNPQYINLSQLIFINSYLLLSHKTRFTLIMLSTFEKTLNSFNNNGCNLIQELATELTYSFDFEA